VSDGVDGASTKLIPFYVCFTDTNLQDLVVSRWPSRLITSTAMLETLNSGLLSPPPVGYFPSTVGQRCVPQRTAVPTHTLTSQSRSESSPVKNERNPKVSYAPVEQLLRPSRWGYQASI
jgi:hypothetical protein